MKRSHGVLGGGLVIAIAVAALAALLAPDPAPLTASPGNVVLPVPRDQPPPPDRRVMLDGLLEKLIVEADVVEDPGSLPALATFVVLVERDLGEVDWVVTRLAREDVPWKLPVAFADDLPAARKRLDGVVHTLLIRLLTGDDAEARRAAVEVLKDRGQFAGTFDRGCDCIAGTYSHAGASWTIRHARRADGTTTVEPVRVDTSEGRL